MSYLDSIVALRRRDTADEQRDTPAGHWQNVALARAERRDFVAALRAHSAPLAGRPAVIAEIKRASSSRGTIRADCDPALTATQYALGGAAALSVLTETRHFGGCYEDLTAARAACALPVLCKDFIVDEYQIWKALAHGADAVLLIAAILDDAQLRRLLTCTAALSVAALVEVHSLDDVARANAAGVRVFGINNRDLHTFAVDTRTALRLRAAIPPASIVVAESGYANVRDLADAARAGIDAVLVGEALMRAADPEAQLRSLIGEPAWSK